jgi:uroporphyrinogen decarboxylase
LHKWLLGKYFLEKNRMTNKERVLKALKGEEVDRLPVTAWQHFPIEDKTHDGQVEAFLRFQNTYDWDIAKLMYRNTFTLEDWGCEAQDMEPTFGYYLRSKYAIQEPGDWKKLVPLDPNKGALGEMVSVTRVVCKEMGNRVMKLATVFAPFMAANQMAEKRIATDLRENPALLHAGLEVITQTVTAFAQACLDAGADGIFFATTEARKGFATKAEYAEFGHAYNLRVLNAIRSRAEMIMIHICKTDIYFEEFVNYPVDAFNWDDRSTAPSLAEARKLTDKCLMGGIDMHKTLYTGTPDEIEAQVIDAALSAGTRPDAAYPIKRRK